MENFQSVLSSLWSVQNGSLSLVFGIQKHIKAINGIDHGFESQQPALDSRTRTRQEWTHCSTVEWKTDLTYCAYQACSQCLNKWLPGLANNYFRLGVYLFLRDEFTRSFDMFRSSLYHGSVWKAKTIERTGEFCNEFGNFYILSKLWWAFSSSFCIDKRLPFGKL